MASYADGYGTLPSGQTTISEPETKSNSETTVQRKCERERDLRRNGGACPAWENPLCVLPLNSTFYRPDLISPFSGFSFAKMLESHGLVHPAACIKLDDLTFSLGLVN